MSVQSLEVKHSISLLFSFLFVSPIVSQGQEKPLDLSGKYTVAAPDAGYTGTVVIRKDGQVYNLLWRIKGSGKVHQGVGVLIGRTRNANWGLPVAGQEPVPVISNVGLGVVVYQVGPNDRVLTGLYAQFGSNRVFRENLTRTK